VGQAITVYGCNWVAGNSPLVATALGEIVEDYNNFYGNRTPRTSVAAGTNSVSYMPLFDYGLFYAGADQVSGIRVPKPGEGSLLEWSQLAAIADGGTAAAGDLSGIPRPVTDGKRSWGAVQFSDVERDTATVRTGTSSLMLSDAGVQQFWVPHSGVQMTVSVYVYREANDAGTNPRLVIKQPGQSDRITTDAGAAGGWNLLADTFTPAADPEYVVVELQSHNTAAAGNYAVYFDDLTAA